MYVRYVLRYKFWVTLLLLKILCKIKVGTICVKKKSSFKLTIIKMLKGLNFDKDNDIECLSAKLIDHEKNHATDLYSNPVTSLQSSICSAINEAANETKLLNSLSMIDKSFKNESLKDFIRNLWTVKHKRGLSDETVMCALTLLLPEPAYQWWEETKPFVKSWHLAVAILLKVLNDKRTLLDAWRDSERSNYQHDKPLKTFLNEQRILFVEIRQFYKLTEGMEIDLIYDKLNSAIRKKIERKKITSFDVLTKLVDEEHLLNRDPNIDKEMLSCLYCKRNGHTMKTCRNKKDDSDRDEQKDRYHSSSIPSISIRVNGIPDFAHLSTDSEINIINDQLYCKLVERGCLFESTKQVVSTMYSKKKQVLQLATVTVEFNGLLVATPVVKLQNTRGIKNCFGGHFVEACDLLMDVGEE